MVRFIVKEALESVVYFLIIILIFLVSKGACMNWDQIEGKWEQLIGKAKEKWGSLTDDDWKVAEGKRDQLAGRIQERYGYSREKAEKELDDWLNDN